MQSCDILLWHFVAHFAAPVCASVHTCCFNNMIQYVSICMKENGSFIKCHPATTVVIMFRLGLSAILMTWPKLLKLPILLQCNAWSNYLNVQDCPSVMYKSGSIRIVSLCSTAPLQVQGPNAIQCPGCFGRCAMSWAESMAEPFYCRSWCSDM